MAIKNSPKIAVVIDWLWKVRGSEKVLNTFLSIYPDADVYALFGDTKNLKSLSYLYNKKIQYSVLQKFPFIRKFYRYTYFLWPLVIEQFNLKNYDLVISFSTSVAKGVITGINTTHICYMNSPMRYAWDLKSEYFNTRDFSLLKRLVIPFFLHFIRIWDITSNTRIDYLIASSKFIKDRISKYYKLKVDRIIYPPVTINSSNNNDLVRNDFYYFHSALEVNKGIIQTVQCAIKYNLNLVISGTGSLQKQVQKIIKGHENIKYLGFVTDQERDNLYMTCKAVIFPSIEDFGIVPLEANSFGTPVIALNYGGTKETVLDGVTGVLVNDSSPESIYNGILQSQKINWNSDVIKKQSNNFNEEIFKKEIKSVIDSFIDTKHSF